MEPIRREAEELAQVIHQEMWDPERKFYFDLTMDGKRAPAKTIAAYWTLLAGVASAEQAEALRDRIDPGCGAQLPDVEAGV